MFEHECRSLTLLPAPSSGVLALTQRALPRGLGRLRPQLRLLWHLPSVSFPGPAPKAAGSAPDQEGEGN